MKKIALIVLVSIYSMATFGISLKGFYCCGNLTSVSLSLSGQSKQDRDKNSEKEGCCKTSYQFFKVSEKHFASNEVSVPATHFAFIHFFTNGDHKVSFLPAHTAYFDNSTHAPPLYHGIPVFLSNCVFRI